MLSHVIWVQFILFGPLISGKNRKCHKYSFVLLFPLIYFNSRSFKTDAICIIFVIFEIFAFVSPEFSWCRGSEIVLFCNYVNLLWDGASSIITRMEFCTMHQVLCTRWKNVFVYNLWILAFLAFQSWNWKLYLSIKLSSF